MGQSSLPILNKVGLSMRWDSSYDNNINFKTEVLRDIFIKKFFDHIFDDKVLLVFYKNFFYKNHKIFNLSSIFKLKKKKVPVYPSKIWLLQYQKWVVVSVYLYIPKIFLRKLVKLKKLKTSNHLSFYNFFSKTNKNKNLYKYSL